MYIKQLKNSNQPFGKLIRYFLDGYQKGDPQIFKNTGLASTPKELAKAFEENAKFRHVRSKKLKHCIMSFMAEDSQHLEQNPAILYDLAEKYLELRGYGNNALVYGVIHKPDNTKADGIQHYHWHFMVSTNRVRSHKSTRRDLADYVSQDIELELYQREKYPHLQSIVYTRLDRTKEKKPQRTPRETNKDFIRELFNTLADEASNLSELYRLVEKHEECTLYTTKKGVINGVWYKGCKYRFKRYISPERYEILCELEELRKLREKPKTRGFSREY